MFQILLKELCCGCFLIHLEESKYRCAGFPDLFICQYQIRMINDFIAGNKKTYYGGTQRF
jgi:hypothetical protein